MSNNANLQKDFKLITSDGKIIMREFSKPLLQNIFFRNRDYLIEHSEEIEFNQMRWVYNPHQFCLDHYSILHLFPIIILCNNIKSIFEFTYDNLNYKIIAPKTSAISNIMSYPRV